jgi:hypothetical protein
MPAGVKGARLWVALFATCVAVLGAVDGAVLQLTQGYFGSGFNSYALLTWSRAAGFFALGLAFDVALLATLWLALLAPLRRLLGSPLRALAATATLALALPIAFELALHRLHRVLGQVLDIDLLLDLAAGSRWQALAEAAQDLPSIGLLGSAFGAGLALQWWIAGAFEARLATPPALPSRRLLAGLAGLGWAIATAALWITSVRSEALFFGLDWKPAGRVLTDVASFVTDVDRDGSGWLSRPPDPDPWNASISPFALDVAGDGVDQDGIGGDLAVGAPLPSVLTGPAPRVLPGSPSVLLVLLEGVRWDVLGARLHEREVTPTLNRLAREGAATPLAFAHVPSTWLSRAQLMQGRLAPRERAETLVDDFHARGYEVAWFSGQDDAVAEASTDLGWARADHFYDARQDRDLRTSRSAEPISLQVSARTLLGRFDAYLDRRRDDRPLFLYVNLVDTHFPYWHSQLDDLLGVPALARGAIRPENRELVWDAYLNAAANVDAAIAHILARAERALPGPLAVVVTSDHGQAFYERGQLGHGQALDRLQTGVPMVVKGLGGVWPEPIGLGDVRAMLGRALEAGGGAPRFEVDPRREIFQLAGTLAEPKLLGLRDAQGARVWSMRDQRASVITLDERVTEARAEEVAPVIHAWEALRWAEAQTQTAPAH